MNYFVVDAPYVRAHLSDTAIVDVRPIAHYENAHIPGAVNVPFLALRDLGGNVSAKLAEAFRAVGVEYDTPVIVYCQNGGLAHAACDSLAKAGYIGLICYEGSWQDWISDIENPVEIQAHEYVRAA